ncbi:MULTISPECIES: GntR family transcriptional regulator [Diaphorobacter]|uniref:Transcriptional regulator, GntR family n=1 Tax=Acidovorax ebreus (strain TPSY) TaxID=535289 RepID=A0A9J9UA25_ACIET|nr:MULTISPECIES: GntR family transcriptional regulator [Diaphorobacter]ABM41311.1 transcriptional regulator, GntR family [Acidovorax sp. JS42]TFI48085.1 GntR family transcriptional regulator [Diaphorobacter sp. DS2]UOB04856.1 GntR family transcriptional regulator [Diaphorobacter sp. LI3]ACM32470.1 transcriptional regulator, GntR family [[Acidovorax] ebreus TPSY]ASI68809.1 GntR family transcriptional regulator [Diaphorobacter nitroreducens]
MRRPPANSLHHQAAEMLRQQIFAGELAPGSFVDEAALCERLAVSRTPLREALKVLVAEGLLRHEPRRGCFVAEITERDLQEIFPVIALLEGRAAYEATEHAGPADIDALQVLHQRLQDHAEAGRITEYYEANYAIHEAFITLADNRWLAQVIGDLRKILRLARHQTLQVPGRLQQSLSEHRQVFAALQKGDAAAAEQAMRNHLLAQRDALRELARNHPSRITP